MLSYSKINPVNPAPRVKIRGFTGSVVNRIIDANINRLKEGLRVCEEIARFIINQRSLSADFKKIRHKIELITSHLPTAADLTKVRDSLKDVGKNIYINELKRKNVQDIFLANIQRAKESVRVLEEFAKLSSINTAIALKKMRYNIYDLEKKAIKKISALSHR